MRFLSLKAICVGILAGSVTIAAVAQDMNDPYEILDRYFKAMGGLDRLRAERSSYAEGNVNFGGMEGTFKSWTSKPGKSRNELAVGPLSITQGDNGSHAWVLDQNGKLQVITNPDEATVKRREVRRLIDDYAFAERGSAVFTVEFAGTEIVNDEECYLIKISNRINSDSYTTYINKRTHIQDKAVYVEGDESRDAYYSDYREIDGLLKPFSITEIPRSTGQAQEAQLTSYESNPDIDQGVFEPPAPEGKDYRFVEGDRAENIPVKFIEDHLFVPVIVNGKERLWVIDTGAGMSVLNMDFAKELGLGVEGDLKGQGAGGTVDVSFTTMPPFSIRGVQFDEQTVAVIDMNRLIRRLGVDIVGILGFDFLSRFVTKVDYSNELMSLYDPVTFKYTGNGRALDIHIRNAVFGVRATLDGIHEGDWLFDLGAGTTDLDGCYALREGYAAKKGVLRMGHGAANEFQMKRVQCDSIEFAGYTIYDPEIGFSYGGSDTVFTADRIGTLGNSLFRNFVLYCDYANERLILEKGGRFNESWPRDNSGLQIGWSEDHRVEVVYVSPGTPAEEAGFRKGDFIISINGTNVDEFGGIVPVRELLRADPGSEYDIVVDRSGNESLRLILAETL